MNKVSRKAAGKRTLTRTWLAKGTFVSLLLAACTTLIGCSNEEGIDYSTPLQIKVNTAGVQESRAMIEESTLPDASQVGVLVAGSDGGAYNGKTYNNILFQATGTGNSQTWNSDDEILVSDNTGLLYAYYPYNPDVTDFTQIPIETASQEDYMYATPVEVDNDKVQAVITMNHAMAAVRLEIVKGNFSSDATVSNIRIKSTGMGTSALMNAKTGALSSIAGAGTWFTEDHADATITTSDGPASEFLVIPTGNSTASIDMLFTVNGSDYTLQTTPSTTLEPGYIYSYTAVLNDAEVTLKSVFVEPWVTQNKGSQNGVPYSIYVKAVKSDGTLIDVADADESCIAVALVDGPKHFWIEKYETANTSWQTAYTVAGISKTDYTYMSWGPRGTDLSIPNYTIVGGGVNSSSGTPSKKNWRAWGTGALSDFNGKDNTDVLLTTTATDSYKNYPKLSVLLGVFNAQDNTENQGYSDWYVPACGQLYLMYSHKTAINTALTKIGGTTIADYYYWSSSEYGGSYAWVVLFISGYVDNYYKNYNYRVRLVRDIE